MRQPLGGERGFTLIEVMIAIVLLTFGLLAVADILPRALTLGLYGQDQTKSAGLAQQEIECLKNQAALLGADKALNNVGGGGYVFVGDYGSTRLTTPTACNPSSSATITGYFDVNGTPTTAALAYFTRDVQVQYWPWNATTLQFALPASYTQPAGTYVYRVSVATHWPVHGQTIYTSGQATNGCVSGGTAVPLGQGCVQISSFISP